MLFISHDIGTVLDLSDRILVMYAGRIVEDQSAGALLREPLHPYTKGLLGSYGDPRAETVKITYVPGRPPDLSRDIVGCSFAPRCPERIERVPSSRTRRSCRCSGGRAACHVAVLQRAEGGAGRGSASRSAASTGPQFVKTADESRSALTQRGGALGRARLEGLRAPPGLHRDRAPRPSATSASSCAAARSPRWSARAAAASRRSPG